MAAYDPARLKTKKALIVILDKDAIDEARGLPEKFYVQFNPTQYAVSKSVNYEKTSNPGSNLPIVKFVSGEMESLTIELLFDTTDTGMDENARNVREMTWSLYQLTQVQPKTHAPPRIQLTWGGLSFKAVIVSFSETLTLFNPDGVPLRSTVSLTFNKDDESEVQYGAARLESPNRFRVHEVQRGDTLSAIAAKEYDNPALWKVIADENAAIISNPLRLTPGTLLWLPRIDSSGRVVRA